MAYASSIAEVRRILEGGFPQAASTGAELSKGGGVFSYCSSHAATEITGAGFFTGCGANPLVSSGAPHPNTISRSTRNVGMRPGDLLFNIESSGGASPGRATLHAVTASTFGGSTGSFTAGVGYDCTVSAHAAT